MNAVQQLNALQEKMKSIKQESISLGVDFFDKSWSILQDMKAVLEDRVDRFGEKAFNLSDKQVALMETILAEKSAKVAEAKSAVFEADEAVQAEIFAIVQCLTGEDRWYVAPMIYRGEISRFEAKIIQEELRQQREQDAARAFIKRECNWLY